MPRTSRLPALPTRAAPPAPPRSSPFANPANRGKRLRRPGVPGAVTAAAAVPGRDPGSEPRGGTQQEWQSEAWGFYDTVGEVQFACGYIANASSRVTLFVEDSEATLDDGSIGTKRCTLNDADPYAALAAYALQDLAGGPAGHAVLLSALALNLSIPGECWLVGLAPEDDNGVRAPIDDTTDPAQLIWEVYSNEEVRHSTGSYTVDRGAGQPERYDDGTGQNPAGGIFIRIWRPHPARHVEATSPLRAALPVLRQIRALDESIAGALDSRLAGAGVLLLPPGVNVQTPVQRVTPDGVQEEDPAGQGDDFVDNLVDAAAAALEDRSSPAAFIPVIAEVPNPEAIKDIRHMTFATDVGREHRDLRGDDVKRLAVALDMPAEVLTGLGAANHWTGWLLDENAIKVHIEPLAVLICNALTTRYLRLSLEAQGVPADELHRFRIRPDTSALRQRPARTQEALELHSRMVLSDAAVLRETGFDPADAPDDEEKRERLTMQAARGVQTADVTVAALDQLGVVLKPQPAEATTAAQLEAGELPGSSTTPTGESGGTPALPPAPAQETPRGTPQTASAAPVVSDLDRARAVAVLASAEPQVRRAVERARNKVWNRRQRPGVPIPRERLDGALVRAWDDVPDAAELLAVDADALTACLDAYTRMVLTTGREPTRESLARSLAVFLGIGARS